MSKHTLVAFDFDHTVVDDNTDAVARNLLPKDALISAEEVYKETDSWTLYMREIFKCLYEMNVSKQELVSAIQNIKPINDMDNLIKRLNKDRYEGIIISDSNSVFISEWLKFNNLDNFFRKIITNPAWFDDSGLLNIEFYEHQNHCDISEPNLCKGHALENYISERKTDNVEFCSVAYIGDGRNDFCPTLRLCENDFVFPRLDYALHKKIRESEDSVVKAKVFPWSDGSDIIKVFDEIIESKTV